MKKLGIGTMRLPLLDKNDPGKVDLEQFKKMVDLYLEKGFTYFDTAYIYHNRLSENAVKVCLVDRYPRDAYQVATKLPAAYIKSYEDRDKIFNEQLANVGVTYFDNYLIHCVMEANYDSVFEKFDCFNWLFDKKEKGLVKNAGFSFHGKPELLEKILTKYPNVDFVQLQINYLDWKSSEIESEKCYEIACKHNKKVIVMEPIKGGVLANVSDEVKQLFLNYDSSLSIPSWAVRFAASLDNVWFVLSGMSDLDQAKDNLSYMSDFKKLTEEEMNMCHKAAEIINSQRAIKCTKCSYCVAGCPMQIEIPKYFDTYNHRMRTTSAGTLSRNMAAYKEFTANNPKPEDCIECGQCENACPQHLPIRQYLKDISKEFNK